MRDQLGTTMKLNYDARVIKKDIIRSLMAYCRFR